jgi:hypothetical protein
MKKIFLALALIAGTRDVIRGDGVRERGGAFGGT